MDEDTLKEVIKLIDKRIEGFWTDVKTGHLQRVIDGIENKYVDENQALIIVDHLMRLRTYQEVRSELYTLMTRQRYQKEKKLYEGNKD